MLNLCGVFETITCLVSESTLKQQSPEEKIEPSFPFRTRIQYLRDKRLKQFCFFVGFQCLATIAMLRQVNGNLNNAWHDNFIPPSAAWQHAKWYLTMRLRVCGLCHHLVQATVQSLEVALNPLIDAQSSPLNVGDRHVKGQIYTHNAWKAFKQTGKTLTMSWQSKNIKDMPKLLGKSLKLGDSRRRSSPAYWQAPRGNSCPGHQRLHRGSKDWASDSLPAVSVKSAVNSFDKLLTKQLCSWDF